jgi:transposase InsO family protein
MSRAVSPSAKRAYGLARVCRVWRIARSSVYAARRRREIDAEGGAMPRRKRGPRGACTDAELAEHVRRVIAHSPWVGEGHRKVWARLRFEGIRTARLRVLRVMRENDLLAPTRLGRAHGPRAHDGTIVPERPDEIWGTDMTGTMTEEGHASIFLVIDHCTAECLGIHAARRGTRFEALEPPRQAVRVRGGVFAEGVAAGVALRHDHGSQFVSHAYQDEVRFLGIESSPAYVREPEGNGCAERFVRTLKEQLLWLRRFATVEDLLPALQDFKERYNHEWLIERHGWVSPEAHYRRLIAAEVAA